MGEFLGKLFVGERTEFVLYSEAQIYESMETE